MKSPFLFLFLFISIVDSIAQDLISFEKTIQYNAFGIVEDLQIIEILPQDLPGKQQVVAVTFSTLPDSISIKDGIKYAHFNISDPGPDFQLSIKCTLLIQTYDFEIAAKRNSPIPVEKDLTTYLNKEPFIQPNNKKIQTVAESLTGKNEEETVRNIFHYVVDHLDYKNFHNEKRGAVRALKQGKGDCTEYSELMIALCRANDIPARMIRGAVVHFYPHQNPMHNWVEVYFKDYGWVPFDPTFADCNYENCPTTFEHLDARYVQYAIGRTGGQYRYKAWKPSDGSIHPASNYIAKDLLQEQINEATSLFMKKDFTSALAIVDTFLADGFSHIKLLALKTKILCAQDKMKEALSVIQQVGKMANSNHELSEFTYLSALWHAHMSDTSHVLKLLEKWVKMEDDHYSKWSVLKREKAFGFIRDDPRYHSLVKSMKKEYLNRFIAGEWIQTGFQQDHHLINPTVTYPPGLDFNFIDLQIFEKYAGALGIQQVDLQMSDRHVQYTFNRAGQLMQQYSDGVITDYGYDKNGKKTCMKIHFENKLKHPDTAQLHYIYTTNGRLREIRTCQGGCEPEEARIYYRFDPVEPGRSIHSTHYAETGEVLSETIYEYAGDHLAKVLQPAYGDTVVLEWQYAPSGMEITKRLISPDTSFEVEKLVLDEKGRLRERYFSGSGIIHSKFQYNQKGQLQSFMIQYENEQANSRQTKYFSYDKRGVLKKMKHESIFVPAGEKLPENPKTASLVTKYKYRLFEN